MSKEATLVGDVTVAAHASVWPGVVLRGDVAPVRIGERSHVGDNATVDTDVAVGEGSIVAPETVVPDEYEIPTGSFARGVPARVTPLSETDVDAAETFEAYSSGEYTDLAGRHGDLFE